MPARRPAHHSRTVTRRPTRALRRAGAAAALPLAIAVAAVAIAAAGPGSGVLPAATTIRAAGAVTMTNSKAPGAILTASGMKPGNSVQGTVTVTNTGDPAAYGLASSHLLDSSTPALSGQLQLLVEDITGAPVQVYSGAFAAMPAKALGSFASGEARTYRFTVTLPHSAGNPYQVVTPHGRAAMQALHDVAARSGALCRSPAGKPPGASDLAAAARPREAGMSDAEFTSPDERDALQAIHDTTSTMGARCATMKLHPKKGEALTNLMAHYTETPAPSAREQELERQLAQFRRDAEDREAATAGRIAALEKSSSEARFSAALEWFVARRPAASQPARF